MTTEPAQLQPGYLDDLPGRPIEELRSMRAQCIEIETGLSYLRRMVQTPLDIVERERARRAVGEHAELSDLIEELPGILAEGPRGSGVGRLPQTLEPVAVDPELKAELDTVLGGADISKVTDVEDGHLASLHDSLVDFERKISERRRAFHELIDTLQAELIRRYRSGEVTVESWLG